MPQLIGYHIDNNHHNDARGEVNEPAYDDEEDDEMEEHDVDEEADDCGAEDYEDGERRRDNADPDDNGGRNNRQSGEPHLPPHPTSPHTISWPNPKDNL